MTEEKTTFSARQLNKTEREHQTVAGILRTAIDLLTLQSLDVFDGPTSIVRAGSTLENRAFRAYQRVLVQIPGASNGPADERSRSLMALERAAKLAERRAWEERG